MYVDLGPENGGFPINISEHGMAFQGVRPLEKNQEICITIKLDGIGETVIATAKVVWLTASRKGGGPPIRRFAGCFPAPHSQLDFPAERDRSHEAECDPHDLARQGKGPVARSSRSTGER
jgi:hypothetical protein